jgi:drug/metabolite transporter (DMT)-like permease
MSLKRLRGGELLATAGAVCVILSLLEPWYASPIGNLDAWDTFGPAVVLILAALCAALTMVVAALGERSTALPVSTAVWCVLVGLLGLVSAIVRVLERPDRASGLCIGAWLALAGTVAILTGAWQTLRDERPSQYDPLHVEPRPRP